MPELRQSILNFAEKKPRVLKEIMDKFKIPYEKRETLRKRLKEAGVKLREGRGRSSIEV